MQESERILKVKEAVERELMKIPGVHAVGIGPKITGGKMTSEIAIHVLLPRKKPLREILPEEVIPPEIEGIKTDVLEVPLFIVSVGLPDTTRYRPLKGGTQVRAAGGLGAGTLACLAKTTASPIQVVALSNHHVLFSGTAKGPSCWGCTSGSDVGQPTTSSGDVIGSNLRGFANEQIDAAIAVVSDGTQYLAEVEDFGLISSVRTTPITQDDLMNLASQPTPQKFFVNKRGRTTGLTRGWIASANLTGGPVLWPDNSVQRAHYVNQLLVVPASFTGMPGSGGGPPLTESGDSGSLVIDDNHQAVALLFSEITDPSSPITGSYLACHITDIQTQLGIALETATVANQVRTATTVAASAPHAVPSPSPSPSPAPAHPASAVFHPPSIVVKVEQEISDTPAGRMYVNLLRKHAPEIHHLVNHNRRVATVWHRCKGPKILQSCLRLIEDTTHALPIELEGMSLRSALERFSVILQRYGSAGLAADMKSFAPRLADFAGMTYLQIKGTLQATDSGAWTRV